MPLIWDFKYLIQVTNRIFTTKAILLTHLQVRIHILGHNTKCETEQEKNNFPNDIFTHSFSVYYTPKKSESPSSITTDTCDSNEMPGCPFMQNFR